MRHQSLLSNACADKGYRRRLRRQTEQAIPQLVLKRNVGGARHLHVSYRFLTEEAMGKITDIT